MVTLFCVCGGGGEGAGSRGGEVRGGIAEQGTCEGLHKGRSQPLPPCFLHAPSRTPSCPSPSAARPRTTATRRHHALPWQWHGTTRHDDQPGAHGGPRQGHRQAHDAVVRLCQAVRAQRRPAQRAHHLPEGHRGAPQVRGRPGAGEAGAEAEAGGGGGAGGRQQGGSGGGPEGGPVPARLAPQTLRPAASAPHTPRLGSPSSSRRSLPARARGSVVGTYTCMRTHFPDKSITTPLVHAHAPSQAPGVLLLPLLQVYCEWAEMELRHSNYKTALDLLRRATAQPPRPARMTADEERQLPVQQRLYRWAGVLRPAGWAASGLRCGWDSQCCWTSSPSAGADRQRGVSGMGGLAHCYRSHEARTPPHCMCRQPPHDLLHAGPETHGPGPSLPPFAPTRFPWALPHRPPCCPPRPPPTPLGLCSYRARALLRLPLQEPEAVAVLCRPGGELGHAGEHGSSVRPHPGAAHRNAAGGRACVHLCVCVGGGANQMCTAHTAPGPRP